jgi:hypothetical protein
MDPQGYDAGKKVTGRKRHILVDTLGAPNRSARPASPSAVAAWNVGVSMA